MRGSKKCINTIPDYVLNNVFYFILLRSINKPDSKGKWEEGVGQTKAKVGQYNIFIT